jgi:O-antigen ligase
MGLIVSSTLWAVNPADTAMRGTGLLLAFVFIWNLIRTTELVRIASWVADGLLYASYATIILIAVGGGAIEPEEGPGRLNLANDLLATGTAELCLWAFVRLFAEGMMQVRNRRILHFLLAAIALAAMVRTGTRGTVLQLAVVLPLLASIRLSMKNIGILTTRYVLLAMLTLGAAAATWACLSEQGQASYRALFRIDKVEGIEDSRSFVWRPAMAKAKERPLLGRGFGSSSFYEFSDHQYRAAGFGSMPWRTTVHSQYLEVFYEFGMVGFLLFAWLLGALLQNVVRIYSFNGAQAGLWRIHAVYVVTGLVAGLTHGGQITTGQLMNLPRWMIYCCVLVFPLARSEVRTWLAPSRVADRFGALGRRRITFTRQLKRPVAAFKSFGVPRRTGAMFSRLRRLRLSSK